MGMSSDLYIEMHNDLMLSDPQYAEDYIRHCEEEAYFAFVENWDAEPESDYRLDFRGYEEFRCQLCDGFGASENGHSECHDEERARAAAIDDWFDDLDEF